MCVNKREKRNYCVALNMDVLVNSPIMCRLLCASSKHLLRFDNNMFLITNRWMNSGSTGVSVSGSNKGFMLLFVHLTFIFWINCLVVKFSQMIPSQVPRIPLYRLWRERNPKDTHVWESRILNQDWLIIRIVAHRFSVDGLIDELLQLCLFCVHIEPNYIYLGTHEPLKAPENTV